MIKQETVQKVAPEDRAKKSHAVDIVGEIIAKLSASKPIYFQRNGALFIASEGGFGLLRLGLSTDASLLSEPEWVREKRQTDFEELQASSDAIKELNFNNSGHYQKVEFVEGEEKYVAPIWFRNDSQSFTLDDMVKTAGALTKLPDDGRIRLVNHTDRYHSHKHGYAADGMDVFLASARVMDRKKYLELFRKKEDRTLGLDCVIITPDLRASFPTYVVIKYDDDGDLDIRKGYFDGTEKSPFGFHLSTEKQAINVKDAKAFDNLQATLIARMQKALGAVASSMPQIEEYVSQTNEAYKQLRQN